MFREFLVILSFILSVFCEHIYLHEGAWCNWKGAIGTCVSLYQCESAPLFHKNKEYPPICGFIGKVPVICCTDCNTVEDYRGIKYTTEAAVIDASGQKAHDGCLNYIDTLDYDCRLSHHTIHNRTFNPDRNCYTLAVNLIPSVPEEIRHRNSHLALLGYGTSMETAEWLCAGAIVSEKYILTAAHCLTNDDLGDVTYVAVGINKRTESPENWQRFEVKRVRTYAKYEPSSLYHDIALVEITEEITFSKDVLPACLNSDDNIPASKANVVVWNTEGKNKGTLRQVPVLQFNKATCSKLFAGHEYMSKGYRSDFQMCYGDLEKPVGSCQSDGGAPLTAIVHGYRCAQLLVGVTSVGKNCNSDGTVTLFTKVSFYTRWLQSIIWRTTAENLGQTRDSETDTTHGHIY